MHLFIEKRIRGGIFHIAKRHSKTNNKYMECYDSSKESIYINCHDANNLYDWAMSQYLPYSGFKWLNEKEISDFCLNSVSENSSIDYSGFKWLNEKEISDFCLNSVSENSSIDYILEVDLEYPIELQDLHNDYPLTPEKLEINQNMLSKYCFNI